MPIAKITGQGLCAIACSVALLWSCVIGERLMLHNAATERVKVMREMQQLQQQPRPVNVPIPRDLRRTMVTAS